jgi:hypothetical protein
MHSCTRMDQMAKVSFQLEHTGSTITQTVSGLWLDSRSKDSKKGLLVIPSEDEPRLQWLLNAFLFVNLLQLVAVWGLGYLSKKKRKAQEGAMQREGDVEGEERRNASGSPPGDERLSPPLVQPARSPSDRTSDSDPTTSPLLRPGDAPSIYQSYGTHPPPHKSLKDSTLLGAITPAEVRRGKLFASLCAVSVAFAWLLFFITSFIRIRSRGDREGHL